MRGGIAIAVPLVVLVTLSIVSGTSRRARLSGRTSRRLVGRLVEESQRALARADKKPVTDLVNVVTARTWAQAAVALAGEDGVQQATGVDPRLLVDKAHARVERAARALNSRLPRKQRAAIDTVLAVTPMN